MKSVLGEGRRVTVVVRDIMISQFRPSVRLSQGAGTGGAGWAVAHPGKNQGGRAWPTLEILAVV